MTFAQTERAEVARELIARGPDAPTLCEGWTTHDLAAHLWVREQDPIAAPGLVARPLADLTERRMAAAKERWSYAELVERWRRGPHLPSLFALPGVDEAANAVEYFVHLEDVRRAGDEPAPPRELDPAFAAFLWKRLKLMARPLLRRSPVGLVLEGPAGEQVRATPGARVVTVVGEPGELTLLAFGRLGAARVRLIGTDADVAALRGAELGV